MEIVDQTHHSYFLLDPDPYDPIGNQPLLLNLAHLVLMLEVLEDLESRLKLPLLRWIPNQWYGCLHTKLRVERPRMHSMGLHLLPPTFEHPP